MPLPLTPAGRGAPLCDTRTVHCPLASEWRKNPERFMKDGVGYALCDENGLIRQFTDGVRVKSQERQTHENAERRVSFCRCACRG